MAAKKYVSLNKLSVFLDKLKQTFATKTETDANLVTAKQYADDKTSNLLSYATQTLTNEQKVQARANIEAVSISDISDAIVDVGELPTVAPNDSVFYRLVTATMISNQKPDSAWTCYCVDGLPSIGTAVANATLTNCAGYYNIQDGVAYGYVDNILSFAFSVPIGWYPLSALLPIAGFSYGGVIANIADDPKDRKMRILLKNSLYSYKEGLWTPLGSIDSDVFSVDENGTAWFAGDVFVGGTGIDGSAKMLATNEYVDNKVGNIDLSKYAIVDDTHSLFDTALRHSDTNLNTALRYSDTNLNTAKSYADKKEETILTYTDNVVAQKSQVQIIVWEAGD